MQYEYLNQLFHIQIQRAFREDIVLCKRIEIRLQERFGRTVQQLPEKGALKIQVLTCIKDSRKTK